MLTEFKKIWELFPPEGRIKLLMPALMMIIAAGLELLGIGALLPILGVMQQPDLIQTNKLLSSLSGMLGNPSQRVFFIWLLVLFLLLFVAKNVFLLLLSMLQFRFIATEQAALSTKLLSSYMHRPYTFHLQANTAQLLRNTTTDVSNVFYLLVIPLMTLVSEGIVIFAISILIIIVNPIVAVFSSCFGGFVIYLYYRLLRGKLARIGEEIQDSGGKFMQFAQEGLGGIKEIKVLSRENYFQSAFLSHIGKYTNGVKKSNIISVLPRLVLETLFILIFVGMLLILTLRGRLADAVPLMAVYAASAFRFIPSLGRIMNATSQLSVGRASIDLVAADWLRVAATENSPGKSASLNFKTDITLKDIRYRYPSAENDAIKQISLTIKRGELIGFIGKSGSGKTTLIDIILGLLTPSDGQVLVDGKDIQKNVSAWQNQIGYIPQTIYLTDDTLRRNIALGLYDNEIVESALWQALDAARLSDFVKTLPDGLNTIVGERGVRLSGGQRQRIGIARAMYHNPEVLILDEATSALDNETEKEITNTIQNMQGLKTILVIAHRLTTIEGCDRVYYLKNGELLFGGTFKDAMLLIGAENDSEVMDH